ncbi:prephenate dehydrogenase dimerization domain-containing protein [Pseudomonas citronellolis]|uniref:prephenate dehydrogenase dimerization domain-containing protein n=1 Tax=Pseudomonas citronellolis TaxID=53408 RepID=UPI0022BA682E|nr:prephenate dehydrogenase dimerization domain-containing protein [Pseudomonas citronellolis]WBG61841.1 prephenate dehydrogenase/arogenate dehydrogenase family protein [Pseudomonas citronellolis]
MDKVLILGGAGRVGQFINNLLEAAVGERVVIDLMPPREPTEHRVMSALDLPTQAPELLREASTLVFAMPEDAALGALERLAEFCQARVVINTCSVQVPFQRAMRKLLPSVTSVGINPMFSPSLNCRGRSVALCEPVSSPAGEMLEGLLASNGMNVRRLTPDDHDQIMALCQTLPHAAILAFAMTLARSGCDMKTLDALSPPPMKTMLALVARMLQNAPQTYWDIQKYNTGAQEQRDQLIANLDHLNSMSRQPTVADFASELGYVRVLLGEHAGPYGEACANLFDLLVASGRKAKCQK